MDLITVDPEVAARDFARDLHATWSTGRPHSLGWSLSELDPLTAVVELPGRRGDGTVDPYFIRLSAVHYGPHPPHVNIVTDNKWEIAEAASPWFPALASNPGWFGLHAAYPYQDGTHRQLVCFSFNADYYLTNHTPKPTEVWVQGRHTVAATLYRLQEVFGPPYYRAPSSARVEIAA